MKAGPRWNPLVGGLGMNARMRVAIRAGYIWPSRSPRGRWLSPTAASEVTAQTLLRVRDRAEQSPGPAGCRRECERQQRVRGVVVGRLDRGPAHDVVLVPGLPGVERAVMTGAAPSHALHRAETHEVVQAARAVGHGTELDVALAGQRACQVRDFALHAVRERRSGAHHERAAPAVAAEGEVQLLLREGRELRGPAVALVQGVGDVQAEGVR